jgi:hypothetical protein
VATQEKLMKICSLAVFLLSMTACTALLARTPRDARQEKPTASEAKPARPAARPKDVESLDSIVAAVYDSISGPAGERDWDRFRSLFVAEARLIAVVKNLDGTFTYRAMTVDDYVQRAGDYFRKNAFYEREVARKTEQFGQIAHVFTTYESRQAADAKPFSRGINSMQFFKDGKRWWCVTIYWDAERVDNPIPERYLTR